MRNNSKIENDLMGNQSLFWNPLYLDISAWIEHVPFAMWLTEVTKPKCIVELGVHNGVSYFSFCQAIRTLNADAVCYGIDTWQGDEHAGLYGPEVFEKVSNYNVSNYSRFSTLIRSTFDESVNYFTDESIDLLHIDGLHTYEAVKHDFETWLPKLKKNAIVLLHDINVRERNFGVFKLWEELKATYNHFQFDYGHGLGILVLGNSESSAIEELYKKDEPSEIFFFLRNFFSEKGRILKTGFETGFANTAIKQALESLNASYKVLEDKNNQLAVDFKNALTEHHYVKERFASFEIIHKELNEKYSGLYEIHQKLSEKHTLLNQRCEKLEQENDKLNTQIEYEKQMREQFALLEKLKKSENTIDVLNSRIKEMLEKNNSFLNEQTALKKNLTKQEQKSAELNDLFTKFIVDNAWLKEENESLKKNVSWYKATFENRSLAGIIKDKLHKTFKK